MYPFSLFALAVAIVGASTPRTQAGPSDNAVAVTTTIGATKRIPCPTNPKLTYDLYLPKSYGEKTDTRFPVLFISSPHKNPGFRGLQSWAETNDVVLVTINDSENGPIKPIVEAQEAVLDAVKGLRIHPGLRFATGFSGAAAASSAMALRHPESFAGVLLQCHSGFPAGAPKHLSVAFVGGVKDTTHPDKYVRSAATNAARGDRYCRQAHLDMGHDWAPVGTTAPMLTHMLTYARLTHPSLSPKERAMASVEAEALVKKAAAAAASAESMESLDPLLCVGELKNKSFRARALDLWCAARAAQIDGMPGKDAFAALSDNLTKKRFDECRGPSAKTVENLRKKLRADTSLKNEFVAWKEFEPIRDAYERLTRGIYDKGSVKKVSRKDFIAINLKLESLVKKHAGTHAANVADALWNAGIPSDALGK